MWKFNFLSISLSRLKVDIFEEICMKAKSWVNVTTTRMIPKRRTLTSSSIRKREKSDKQTPQTSFTTNAKTTEPRRGHGEKKKTLVGKNIFLVFFACGRLKITKTKKTKQKNRLWCLLPNSYLFPYFAEICLYRDVYLSWFELPKNWDEILGHNCFTQLKIYF